MGLGDSVVAAEELVLTVIQSVAHAVDTFLVWLLSPLVLLIRVLIMAWAWAAWAVARAWEPVGRYGWHVVVLSVIVCTLGVGASLVAAVSSRFVFFLFFVSSFCFQEGMVQAGGGAGARRRRPHFLLAATISVADATLLTLPPPR